MLPRALTSWLPSSPRGRRPQIPRLRAERLEDRLVLTAQAVDLIDPSLVGVTGGGDSSVPSITADGQLVAFASSAENLVPNDTNGRPDAFVYDRTTGAVTLVSVGADGFAAGIDGNAVAVSPDGRYVAFVSGGAAADHPVVGGVSGQQVYLRDLQTGTTTVASAGPGGAGNGASLNPLFTADGHHLLFQSNSANIVPGVAYSNAFLANDVYERDLTTGAVTLVTRSLDGTAGVDGATGPFGASADGRFVVFQSAAHNQVELPTDQGHIQQVFVRDVLAGTTALASIAAGGLEAGSGHNMLADGPRAISADGRYVVFHSDGANILPGVAGTQSYVRDLVAGTTTLLSASTTGQPIGGGGEVVSPDGRWAAFASGTSGDPRVTNGKGNVYVMNLRTGQVQLASVNAAGTSGGNGDSGVGTFFDAPGGLSFSPNGHFLAFRSKATDLTAGVVTGNRNLYLRDLDANVTRLATPNAAGTNGAGGDADTIDPAVFSADGRYVAFEETAGDAVAGDVNGVNDVFVRDTAAGTTAAASVRTPLLPAAVPAAEGAVLSPYGSSAQQSVSGSTVSADGRFVAFTSSVSFTTTFSSLAPGVTFRSDFSGLHAFVRDRQTGGLTVVDLDPTGKTALGGFDPILSADGRYVVFLGYTNMLPAGVAYTDPHDVNVFVRDLVTNTTTLVSVDPTGTHDAPIAGVFDGELTISADGRYVAWTSIPPGAVAGVQAAPLFNESSVYLRDLQAGTTQYVSHDLVGDGQVNGTSGSISLSADGRFVVFRSTAPDLTANDTNSGADVFRWDRTTGAVVLVSRNLAGTGPGNQPSAGNSSRPVVSADGRVVVFDSVATDLIQQDPLHPLSESIYKAVLPDDGGPATVSLVFGSTAGNSYYPSVSADGGTVAFISEAHPTTDAEHTVVIQNVYATGPGGLRLLSQSTRPPGGTVTVGPYTGNGESGGGIAPVVSPDGRYVAFLSDATDLVPGFVDANGAFGSDLYVYDLSQGLIRPVSINQSGTAGGNATQDSLGVSVVSDGSRLRFSGDGGTLVFDSDASDLLIGDRNGQRDVFTVQTAGFGTIAGRVFAADAAGNPLAGGLPFWTVYADLNNNGRPDAGEPAVITDTAGNYALTGLTPGAYTVRAVPQAGYTQTAPAGAAGLSVTIAADGTTVSGRNFGEYLPLPDLTTTAVGFGPAAVAPGQAVTVTWTETNRGPAAAVGGWQDGVYLSPTPTLGAGAVLVATVPHTGGLAAGASYAGSATFAAPAATGTYYVIVKADRRSQVYEGPFGAGRPDETAAAAGTLTVAVPALTLGTPAAGQLTAASPDRYYQITVPAGGSLVFALSSALAGELALYVTRNGLPTTYAFDFAARTPGQPGQVVTVPVAQGGTYYVLVHGVSGAAATGAFTLTATEPGFGVQSIDRTTGGNAGRVTIPVHGTDLTPTTRVSLVLGSTVIPAAAVEFRDASLLYATFDLTGRPVGAYTVRVSDGAAAADAPGAFAVTAGSGPNLQVHLGTPSAIRLTANPTVDLEVDYANTGDADMPAPVFVLSVDQGGLEFLADGHPVPPSLKTVEFYGAGSNSPGGVLRAGDSGTVRVRLSIPPTLILAGGGSGGGVTGPGGSNDGVTVTLTTLPTDTTPIDWASLKPTLQPASIPSAAWDVVYNNFTSAVGSTTGQLQAAVVTDTAYLNQIGVSDPTFAQILAFELLKADAALPVPTLAETTDLSVPAPGLALDFGRQFFQSISGRNTLGTLGYGWVSGWDISAAAQANGDVLVTDAGVPRYFTKQADGTFRAAAGDYARLYATGGTYRLVEKDGSALQFLPDGRLDYAADPNGNRVTAGYNAAHQLVTLTQSDGQALTITYTAGRIATVTDPTGRTAAYTYDAAGTHLLSVTTAAGTTSYTYVTGQGANRENALASAAAPSGTVTNYTYDALGRLGGLFRGTAASPIDPVAITYPSPGGVRFTDGTGGATTVDYDEFGRPARVTDALGRTTRVGYDAAGNVTGITLPDGLSYTYRYDTAGNLTGRTDPLGHVVGYTYGPQSTLTSQTDANGHTTRYGYDAQGNLLAVTYADGSKQTFSYDPLGDLTDTVNRRGDAVAYAYNAAGQVTTVTFKDGSTLTYAYDAHGNLKTATDATGTTTLSYDAADRLTGVAYPNGNTLTFTYNALGQRTRSVDQTGYAVNYAYDAAGRLVGLTDAGGNPVAAYTYDAAGRLVEKDLGNGTYTTYGYDAAGELLHLVNHGPRPGAGQDGPVQSEFDYTYDADGNVLTEATPDGSWAYAHDAAGQLVHAVFTSANTAVLSNQDITYAYDAAGNRTQVVTNGVTTTYTTNSLNEYTQTGGTTYTYDADGNLATATTGGVTTAYTFDDLNRLTGLTEPTGTTTHTYDALGNLAATTAGGLTTTFLNDPTGYGNVTGLAALFGEFTGGSATHYAWGLGLVSQTAPGGPAYYAFDGLGSVAAITDAAAAVVNRYAYQPFGSVSTLAAGVANRFTFIGQFGVQADAGGLLRMGFRDYDPTTGQFASDDPLGLGGGDANVRRYVGNNPVGRLDPIGLSDQIPVDPEMFPPGQVPDWGPSNGAVIPAEPNPYGVAQASINKGALIAVAVYLLQQLPNIIRAAGGLQRNPVHFHPENFGDFLGAAAGRAQQAFIPFLSAFDPNNLVGPAGYGSQGFLTPGGTLPYSIEFENDPKKATVAAEDVTVTTTLDPNLDWSTFELGSVQFGSTVVAVPAGLQSYSTSVSTTNVDGTPLRVDITAALNPTTGVVTWTFLSIDPATGLTPTNPVAGFLPVDDSTGRGEASVGYTVRAKAGLPTGAAFSAQASIVFDVNPAIATNTVTNTIDATAPTSSATPLPATTTSPFTVTWGGSDGAGSGVASYTVYVSDNGGAFAPWLTATTQTSAAYAGQVGHTYAFYTVATDNVGFVQPTPVAAQTTTTVTAAVSPSLPVVSPLLVGVSRFAVGADVGGPSAVAVYNPDGSAAGTRDPFPGFTGGVRTAVGDFNGDGVPDVVAGTGPGVVAEVKVLDGKTGAVLFDVKPFADFTGGVFVAAGDVTGDGKADLVITPDLSGGPRVEIYEGGDFALVANFFGIDDPNFRGGARAAVGDLNGDGHADLVISAGFGGGPRISVYDGAALAAGGQAHLVPDFFLFEDTLRNGAYVAVGDVDGDGAADIIGGGGPGGGPRVLVVSGRALLSRGAAAALASPVASLFAGDPGNRDGVRVAAKDLDGDALADVVAGGGTGGAVTTYRGKNLAAGDDAADQSFDPFAGFAGGIYVG